MKKEDVLKIIDDNTSTEITALEFSKKAFETFKREEDKNFVFGNNDIKFIAKLLHDNIDIHVHIDNIDEQILDDNFSLLDAFFCNYIHSYSMSENYNLVKSSCEILNITQKDLATELGVKPTALSNWANGDIPQVAKKALELLVENKNLKYKLNIFKEAHKIASTL